MSSREVLRKNGKAFSWAASFLSKENAADISDLYAFCRYVDDLVDVKNQSCEKVLHDLDAASSTCEPVKKMIALQKRLNMSIEPAKILVTTLNLDRPGTSLQTKGELIRYCFGVASTVGLMMCEIFEVTAKQALPFAIDLGIGMQLTNIARDVYEDAKNARIYLPQEFFIEKISAKAIVEGNRLAEILSVRNKILNLADLYYQSADKGMAFLPRKARIAILVASRLYQAKGKVIASNPSFYFQKRADVPLSGKIYHTLRALASFPRLSRTNTVHPDAHNASLHLDLKSFPSANFL